MACLLKLCCLSMCLLLTQAGELTFELPDNERQCFHETIDKGIKCTLEFQVCTLVFKHVKNICLMDLSLLTTICSNFVLDHDICQMSGDPWIGI